MRPLPSIHVPYAGYSAEYQAVYDSYDVKPHRHLSVVDDEMVQGWVDDGVWDKLDAIWILANHAAGADSLRNWKQPAGGPSLMDEGKGVFTEITDPLVDVGKGVFTENTTELITNGDLSSADGWTEGVFTIGGGVGSCTGTVGSGLEQGIATIGKWYTVNWELISRDAGFVKFYSGGGGTYQYEPGVYEDSMIAQSGNFRAYSNAFEGSVDNVSVIEQNVESWTAFGTNTIENDNGALKITYSNDSNGARQYLRETYDLNTDLTVGKTYRLRIKAKSYGTVFMWLIGPNVNFATVNTDVFTWYEIIFIATHATSNAIQMGGMVATEIIWIDEWTLVEQNVESWTAYFNNIIENDGGALKCTYVDASNGCRLYLSTATDLSTNFVIGKTYRVRVKAKVNTGSVTVYVDGRVGGTTDSYALTSTSYEWIELFFIAGDVWQSFLYTPNMGPGQIIWIDQWDVQEWTNATVNGSLSWGQWEGYTSNGSIPNYINSNWTASVDAVNYLQDDASLMLYQRTDKAEDKGHGVLLSGDSKDASIRPRSHDNATRARINDSGNFGGSQTESRGMSVLIRTNSTNRSFYRNNSLVGSDSVRVSTGVPTIPMFMLACNGAGGAAYNTTSQLSLFAVGASLDATDRQSIQDRFETRMNYHGKGVIA